MEITNEAKTVLQTLMEENKVDHVRVAYEGMGCCAPQVGLGLSQPEEKDQVENINDIQVAVDERVLEFVQVVKLDVQDNEEGQQQFVMTGLPENNC